MRLTNLTRAGVGVASAALVLVAGATSASAGERGTEVCAEYGWNYLTYSRTGLHIPTGVHWKNGPGGTVSASRETRSETVGYSRTISSNSRYGHVQFGNWGQKMGVKKYYVNSACTVTSSYVGTVTKMPSANSWGYKYWETAT